MPGPLSETFRELAEIWPRYSELLVSYRLSPLYGHDIRLSVEGGETLYLRAEKDRLVLSDTLGHAPEAVVEMSAADWADVLSGRIGIVGVMFAGRCRYPVHQRYILSKLSIVLQSLLTIRRIPA